MTTPATNNTPYQIICNAMMDAGLLGLGRQPSSEHLAQYMGRLNNLVNYLQTRGIKLWLETDFSIMPVAGQGGQGNPYVLGPGAGLLLVKPTRVKEGYFVDTNQNRRPLIPMARQEWDTLSTTSTQGIINSYYADKQQLNLNVYTWLIPNAQAALGTMHLIIQQQVTNSVSLTDTMNFPIEWFLTLEWGLSAQICTGQPQKVIDRCTMMAASTLDTLEGWDVEDAATSFAPDTRTQNYNGRFR